MSPAPAWRTGPHSGASPVQADPGTRPRPYGVQAESTEPVMVTSPCDQAFP
jgi:hypothetical protein